MNNSAQKLQIKKGGKNTKPDSDPGKQRKD